MDSLPCTTQAQSTIQASEAKNFMGKEVIVVSKIGGIRESTGEGKPNYLNLGADYPNQDLTIVVFVNFEDKYKLKLSDLKDKTIRVKGTVRRLQIKEPAELKLVEQE